MTLTVGSLFSGIGGLDLGLERAGMQVVWQSEIDPYACRVLARHWPEVPNLGDITEIDWKDVPRVDLICGGFPCQDISSAGEKAGIDGARSGLWRFYADAIRTLRPRYVLVENVADLLARGMGRVVGDLAEIGYDVEWNCIRAADVGAPIGGRGRDRLFLVAEPHRVGLERARLSRLPLGELVAGAPGSGRDVTWLPRAASDHWATEPDVGRVADGLPAELDLLRGVIGDEQAHHPEAESEAQELVWRVVQWVWEHRELAATSPDLYRRGLRDLVPELPHGRTRGRWLLGQWLEADEELRCLWGRVCAEPLQEAQDMLPLLLERAWAAQRSKEVGQVDRLRALGNAVVPAVAEHVARRIMEVAA